MKELGLYIDQINSSSSAEEAFARFCSVFQHLGYEQVTYSLVTDHPSLNLARQHGFANSYPEDWMKEYIEKDYTRIDPVWQRVFESSLPFFWSDLTSLPDLNPESRKFMQNAADAGLCDGIGIPICNPAGEIAGIGLARKQTINQNDYRVLSAAHLLSVYFNETYRDFLVKPDRPRLTQREHEVLCWASEGKTDDDISSILNISTNTIRFHWKNIFLKLEVRGRTYAVMKAIRLRMIHPGRVLNGTGQGS